LALEFLRWVLQQAAAFPAEGAFAPRLRQGQVHGHSHCELARMTQAASEVARLIAGSPLWRSLSCM
jgi:hypothetical protein